MIEKQDQEFMIHHLHEILRDRVEVVVVISERVAEVL